jgi:hypothetical protein
VYSIGWGGLGRCLGHSTLMMCDPQTGAEGQGEWRSAGRKIMGCQPDQQTPNNQKAAPGRREREPTCATVPRGHDRRGHQLSLHQPRWHLTFAEPRPAGSRLPQSQRGRRPRRPRRCRPPCLSLFMPGSPQSLTPIVHSCRARTQHLIRAAPPERHRDPRPRISYALVSVGDAPNHARRVLSTSPDRQ